MARRQKLQCSCHRQRLSVVGSKIKAQRPGSLWLGKQKDNAKTVSLLCPFERLNFLAFSKFPQAHQTSDLEKLTSSLFSRLVLLFSATKESLTIPIHPHTSFYSFIHIDLHVSPESDEQTCCSPRSTCKNKFLTMNEL